MVTESTPKPGDRDVVAGSAARSLATTVRQVVGSLTFRALATIALVAVVVARVDWSSVGDSLREGDPVYGVLAVVAIALALSLGALRWEALLRLAAVPLARREVFRIYAVTSFANAFLPTSVGGDIARPLMVGRGGSRLVRAATTVLIERLIALVALVLVAWIGIALVPGSVAGGAVAALGAVTAGMVGAALILGRRPAWLRRPLAALLPARLTGLAREAATVAGALRNDRRVLALVLLQSVAFQCLLTMQLVFLARMIHVELPFGLAAVALALVTLAMLIPVTIGGFGVREGSYALILAGGGIGHTDAVTISLLSVVALSIATSPGLVAFARSGLAPAVAEAES